MFKQILSMLARNQTFRAFRFDLHHTAQLIGGTRIPAIADKESRAKGQFQAESPEYVLACVMAVNQLGD